MTGALEIASFRPRRVQHGAETSWRDGVLTVDLESLGAGASREPGIVHAEARLLRPGDPVRVCDVLDAVEPAAKSDDPGATFPGALGRPGTAGRGRTNRIDGVAVLSSMTMRSPYGAGDELPSALVDLDGPGRSVSPWGSTVDVVLAFEPDPGQPPGLAEAGARRATLAAAVELASAAGASGEHPRELERLDLPAVDAALPSVCAIVQVSSEGPGLDTFLYGEPVREVGLPRVIDPREVLDGALTSGAYESPAARNPTACYQRSALLRRLLREHGRTLRYEGVVLTLGYLDGTEEKQRMAGASAELARDLGATGAVCTTYSLGNSHTDTMLTVRACERRGIRAVAIVAEEGGLTDHVPEADAIVTAGNVMERVSAWAPAEVVGCGEVLARATPVLSYLGAATQLGDGHLQAVTA